MARLHGERGVLRPPAIKVGTLEDGRVQLEVNADGVSVTVTFDEPNEADCVGIGIIGANAIGKAARRAPTIVDARGDDASRPLYQPQARGDHGIEEEGQAVRRVHVPEPG